MQTTVLSKVLVTGGLNLWHHLGFGQLFFLAPTGHFLAPGETKLTHLPLYPKVWKSIRGDLPCHRFTSMSSLVRASCWVLFPAPQHDCKWDQFVDLFSVPHPGTHRYRVKDNHLAAIFAAHDWHCGNPDGLENLGVYHANQKVNLSHLEHKRFKLIQTKNMLS